MTRLHLTFPCEGIECVGTLDTGSNPSGLLIVTGGDETRAGAFGGQARLAKAVAQAGFPAFRFDRRGVGDSAGVNRGFEHAAPDIAAALATFRTVAPHVERLTAYGLCDAASALMLGLGFDCDGLVLANPWTVEEAGEEPVHSAASLRSRYAAKLRSPKELARLASGQVDLKRLLTGLRSAARGGTPSALADRMNGGLEAFAGRAEILLTRDDRTAQLFAESWPGDRSVLVWRDDGGHAFDDPASADWLLERVLAMLRT